MKRVVCGERHTTSFHREGEYASVTFDQIQTGYGGKERADTGTRIRKGRNRLLFNVQR